MAVASSSFSGPYIARAEVICHEYACKIKTHLQQKCNRSPKQRKEQIRVPHHDCPHQPCRVHSVQTWTSASPTGPRCIHDQHHTPGRHSAKWRPHHCSIPKSRNATHVCSNTMLTVRTDHTVVAVVTVYVTQNGSSLFSHHTA